MAPLIFLLTSVALAPLQLETDPIGWDAIRELLSRDTKTHGILLDVSVQLTFVKEGAAYLRTVYDGGVDANGAVVPAAGVRGLVNLAVFEQNPNEMRPEEIYRARVDFLTYASTERGVAVQFKESGLATTLLTRDDAEVDLLGNDSFTGTALPAYAPTAAALHSQQTLQRFDMQQLQVDATPSAGLVTEAENSMLLFFGMDTVRTNEFGIAPFATGPEPGNSFSPVNLPFLRPKAKGLYTLELRLDTFPRIKQVSGAFFRKVDIKYELRTNIAGVVTTTKLMPDFQQKGGFTQGPLLGDAGADQRYHFDTGPKTYSWFLQPGDEVSVYGEIYVHDFSSPRGYVTEVSCAMGVGSYLRVSAPTVAEATACPGLLAHEALSRCCEAIAGERDALYSEYFGRTDTRRPYAQDGPGAYRLITNGFLLRGFPLPSAPAPATGETDVRKSLRTSLRALYDGLDAQECLGLGLERREGRQVVRIEERAHFYQPAETLQLGAVSGLKKTPYVEWLYNSVEVGYAHWQSGAANGLDEFNARRTYALPLDVVKKTYPALSTLNAAGYLIEEARRERFAEGNSKEGKADNEIFVIALVRTGGFWAAERTEPFVPGSIAGILSPETTYNLRLSPGRLLRKHGPWIRACLAAEAGQRLIPGVVEGNTHLVSQLQGEPQPLDEAAPVAITDLPAPAVLAEVYEFTVKLRAGQMARLRRAPYGRVSFLDGFKQRKSGHLLRVERNPRTGATQFTLLRAA